MHKVFYSIQKSSGSRTGEELAKRCILPEGQQLQDSELQVPILHINIITSDIRLQSKESSIKTNDRLLSSDS